MIEEENYFGRDKAPEYDYQLQGAKKAMYVPANCLKIGPVVMLDVRNGRDPCTGCTCPREKCGGRNGIVGEDKRFKPTTPTVQKWMQGGEKEKAAKYDAIVKEIMRLEKQSAQGPLRTFEGLVNFAKGVEAIATGRAGGVERWEVDVYEL